MASQTQISCFHFNGNKIFCLCTFTLKPYLKSMAYMAFMHMFTIYLKTDFNEPWLGIHKGLHVNTGCIIENTLLLYFFSKNMKCLESVEDKREEVL